MDIGCKIKQMRVTLNLTQEELANRAELSKGFISQLERNLTSPSIETLIDILECLGTDLKHFFNDDNQEKIVFTTDDVFINEDAQHGYEISWLVTNAQKNLMEPITLTLAPGAMSVPDQPHEGEEFGHVLSGNVWLFLDSKKYKVKAGDSFYFRANKPHYTQNPGRRPAKIIWVSSPPSF